VLRLIVLCLAAVLLAACGDLPRPFQHEGNDEPLAAPRAAQPITVLEVPGRPGLANALVAALEKEDIVATRQTGGDNFLTLEAQSGPGGGQNWRLTNQKGESMGSFSESAPEKVAAKVAEFLRGDDLGATDLAARPRVAIDQVSVTGSLDADLLKRALIAALEQQGIAVVSENAQLRVSGQVRITQGLAGHDLVEITWTAVDAKGVEVGKVNQGSPVMRDDLLSKAQAMTHQIAAGGAEGIKQLLAVKHAS